MAVANVTINAIDNMSATIARLQQQLNNLQRSANIRINGSGSGSGKNGGTGPSAAQLAAMEAAVGRINSAFSRMGSIILAEVVSALKSAVNEIKDIDDQLVVVRRVAGKTNSELAAMTKHAHDMAQEYGIAASDYLKGVATFTKAGYGDQAEGLAELALKLQRAGDVTADVAQQYMTAVDKAYDMQGSIEALTAAMDGANQIGNEFATDVGEIAAGIGKVASIASTAHVGINELTAALGTITAVTQRSGTEAATALRAIFLNIIGDTKTEIEEGAVWTAGEIEGLRDVLELYAPEVVAAAEATGQLIDPMEAIGALAKSYQDGILTEAKLFSMVSDIGGKLRTNQLMVLIKNWGMYQDMLDTFASAAGSVDEEVEQSMDSITAKTEQLHAAWVAMVNDALSTSLIKGFLDGMKEALQSVGNLYNLLGLVVGVVTLLKGAQIGTTIGGLFGISSGVATAAVRGIGLAVTAISVAFSLLNKAVNDYNKNLQTQIEGAAKQSQSAVSSSNEIAKLYTTYLSATEGSETYTQALIALAEALGLTSEAAQGSSEAIEMFTQAGLKQAAAAAKTALDEYNHARESMIPGVFEQNKVYKAASTNLPEWMVDIIDTFEGFNEQVVEVASATVKGFVIDKYTDAETLVDTYEKALELQKKLSEYAFENGKIDLSQFKYYNVLSMYITDMEGEYNTAKGFIDNYAAALADLAIISMESVEKISEADKDLADGRADAFSTKEIEEFVAALDELAGSYDQSTVMGRAMYDAIMKRMADLFPNLINYSGDAAAEINHLAVALSTATKAKNAFDKAMETTPKENKGFSDYQSAYQAYAAEIEAGRVNSNLAMEAAKYLMAGSKFDFAEIYAQQGFRGINEVMKNGPWKTLYGDAEQQYAEGFTDILAKYADKAGKIWDASGQRVIATFDKTKNHVEFTIEDMMALSEVTGLSLDQIWQSIQALGVYGETGSTGVEKITDSLKAMGKEAGVTTDETGKMTVDYEKLLNFMKESGNADEADWENMKQWLDFLNEIGMIELKNVPDVEEGWQNYKDWAAEGAESAEEMSESMREAKEAAAAAGEIDMSKESLDAVNQAADQAREAAQAIYDEYDGILSGLSAKDYEVTILANGGQVWTVTQQVDTQLGLVERTRHIYFDADGNVTGLSEVEYNVETGVRTQRSITFYANGEMSTFDEVSTEADGKAYARHIEYYTDGTVKYVGEMTQEADGAAHERTIQYRADGTIEALTEVTTQADGVVQTRTIHYRADGTIESIESIRKDADGVAYTRFIHYSADGNIESIEIVREVADDAGQSRWIYYFTNGQVTGIDIVRQTANGPVNEHREIKYYANGNIQDITIVAKNADGVTDVTRTFHYDANGKIEGLTEVVSTANGVVTYNKTFIFDAEGNLLRIEVEEIDKYVDGKVRGKKTYYIDGNATEAVDTLNEAEDAIIESTGYDWGEYEIGANVDGVTEALDAAEEEISRRTFEFKAKYNPGLTGLLQEYLEYLLDQNTIEPGVTPPPPGEGGGVEVDLSFEVSDIGETIDDAVSQAQEDADAAPPIQMRVIPKQGKQIGETEQTRTEDGKVIYQASFEIEDSDAVLDVFSELDEETGKIHRIKILTEGDGTQTIEETFTDLEGKTKKTYTTTIDANGNVITTLETAEALAETLERTFAITANANGNAYSRLTDLWNSYRKLNGKKLTITTVVEGDTLPDVEGNAKGTDSFRGGLSLVNEEGPELITANGWAKIMGHGDPTVANIPKGARIYTAEETARILNGVGGEKFWAFANGNDVSGLLGGDAYGGYDLPVKPKEDPKEEPKEPSGGGSSGGSGKDDKTEFWDTIKEYLEYGLKKIEYSIKEYEMSITLLERARDKILKPIEDELAALEYSMSMLQYEVTLLERARDDAVKPLDEQIAKLKEERQISKEDEALEEKKLAVEEARANLLDVMHQRTVRYFNEESGQWEWMVDHKAVQQAQEQLEQAEKAYEDAQADYEITLLERQKAEIEKTYQDQIDALQAQIDEMDRRKEDLEHEQEKITYEYDQSIKPLQEKMDDLQAVYDDLQYYYDRLVDAVEVPTASLSSALTQMSHAAEQYSSQLQDTIKLLDAIYELAPTFSAIGMGDLGQYTAQESHMGDYKADDHSQTVYIERVQVFGQKGQMLGDALRNAGIFRS